MYFSDSNMVILDDLEVVIFLMSWILPPAEKSGTWIQRTALLGGSKSVGLEAKVNYWRCICQPSSVIH
jgi:hypothetical protein